MCANEVVIELCVEKSCCLKIIVVLSSFFLDCASSCNSKIVIITAGAGEPVNETPQDAFRRNVELYKTIVPQIVKHSPNCLLIVVTNPGTKLLNIIPF